MKLPENFHIAVIMDGNGRWGEKHKKSRIAGHEAGMARVSELFEVSKNIGIKYLTLFAFSTENWNRSKFEVNGLMRIFREYITRESHKILGENVRVRFIGNKSAFSKDLVEMMVDLEEKCQDCTGLHLNVAMNYGGQDEILRATRKLIEQNIDPNTLTAEIYEAALDTSGIPAVDLLVRTSGEQRISNFLLWQAAYAELYFTDTLWPDFDATELEKSIAYYHSRTRRFGGN